MKTKLFNALNTICENRVFLQGTFDAEQSYPDEFITFWTDSSTNRSFYSDTAVSYDWTFTVIYYSNNPQNVLDKPQMIIEALEQEGFQSQGKGFDIYSDDPAFTGWVMEFIITEYQTKEITTNGS